MLNIHQRIEPGIQTVEVKKVLEIEGLKCFLHRNQFKDWTISEYQTGRYIASGKTIKETEEKTREMINKAKKEELDIPAWIRNKIAAGDFKIIN